MLASCGDLGSEEIALITHRRAVWSVFAAAAICIYAPTALANAFLGSRALTPVIPNESDVISMDIDGTFTTSGHTILGIPTVVVTGSNISINISSSGCSGFCNQVLTGFSVSAGIGTLSAGTYNDTISIYEDGALVDTLSGTFTVVPEPSTALLFLSGLFCLALRRTSREIANIG